MVKIVYTKRLFKSSPFDEEKEVVKTKSFILPARLVAWWLGRFHSVAYDDQSRIFEAETDDIEVAVQSVSAVFRKKNVFLDRLEHGYMVPDQWERQAVMKEIFRPVLSRNRFGRLEDVSLTMPSCQMINWKAEPKAEIANGDYFPVRAR